MSEQLALLPAYLTAHLQLTLLALLCSAAVSLPLGVAVTRVRWLEQPALGVAGIIQTIPSLALLAVMVPLLSSLGLRSMIAPSQIHSHNTRTVSSAWPCVPICVATPASRAASATWRASYTEWVRGFSQ